MKVHADCVPCLMKRVLFQSRLVSGDAVFASVESGLHAFSDNIDPDRRSVDVATAVHAASYAALGTDDPYLGLKIRADEVAGRFMDRAEALVASSDDPLATAVLASVIGNIMDFGSGVAIDDPDEFDGMFDDLVAAGVGSDDTPVLAELLGGPGHVVFIFDNCGESQLDRILIRHLRGMGKRVVGVVRGEPILNDVTVDDAARTGLDSDLDRLMTTGKFYVGIDPEDIPGDLASEIEGACVVIAKGMANYESLSDDRLPVPVAHILRAKCQPVADSLGVAVGTNVVRVRV